MGVPKHISMGNDMCVGRSGRSKYEKAKDGYELGQRRVGPDRELEGKRNVRNIIRGSSRHSRLDVIAMLPIKRNMERCKN